MGVRDLSEDLVKFGELVACLGPDYEEGCWPTLHKLVGS